jgi:hypothetical protein
LFGVQRIAVDDAAGGVTKIFDPASAAAGVEEEHIAIFVIENEQRMKESKTGGRQFIGILEIQPFRARQPAGVGLGQLERLQPTRCFADQLQRRLPEVVGRLVPFQRRLGVVRPSVQSSQWHR